MKQNFIERNYVAVFKTLQVVYIILACVEASRHDWLDVVSNLLFAVCIELIIKSKQSARKVSKKVEVLFTWNKGEEEEEEKIGNEEKPNLSPDHCSDEIRSLAGRTIREPHKCDNCPNETDGCKKLILAGGDHICVV